MKDGSDAIADWPLLNALVNTASGATWVSIHHGGGRGHRAVDPRGTGHGRRRHAARRARRSRACCANDPGMGVIRHVDAGYDEAIEVADRLDVRVPMREG